MICQLSSIYIPHFQLSNPGFWMILGRQTAHCWIKSMEPASQTPWWLRVKHRVPMDPSQNFWSYFLFQIDHRLLLEVNILSETCIPGCARYIN